MSNRSKVDELLGRIEDTDLRDELRKELERHGDIEEEVEEAAGESSEDQLTELLEKLLERLPDEVPPVERIYPWVSPDGTERHPNPGAPQVVMYGPQPVTRTADPNPSEITWVTTSSSSDLRIGDRIGGVESGTEVWVEAHPVRAADSFTITTTSDTREGR